jgi:DNA-binding transcriptional ArsR family regulator
MEIRRDVFQAIADPTRREIIGMIAKSPMNLNGIASNFDVSRQAISLHVGILIECGLIKVHQRGRERFCEARLDALDEVTEWVDKYRKFWNSRLDALEKFLHNEEQQAKSTPKKRKIKTGRK